MATSTDADLFRDGLPDDLVFPGHDRDLPRPRIKPPRDRRKKPKKRKFLPAVSTGANAPRGPVAYSGSAKTFAPSFDAPHIEFFSPHF